MKPSALTASSPLDQARAELARREQCRDADLAQFGPASSDDSPRNRLLCRRDDAHRVRICRAEEAVQHVELINTFPHMKAAAQADIEQAQASLKVRQADVQREAATLAEAAARATTLEGQIAQLEAGRHAGLDAAQAVLTERTQASDAPAAAAAAEEITRIEAEAATTDARLRPLQLQLTAVGELKTAAEARLRKVESASNDANKALVAAQLEALAIVRDEAALAFCAAHLAFQVADNRPAGGRKNLPVEFTIGASSKVLQALGNVSRKINDETFRRMDLRTDEPAVSSALAIDPMTLEDAAGIRARRAASAARVGVTLTEPA